MKMSPHFETLHPSQDDGFGYVHPLILGLCYEFGLAYEY